MLKNYKELKDAKGLDKIVRRKTLVEDPAFFCGEPLNPRILDHFLPTYWEKNLI